MVRIIFAINGIRKEFITREKIDPKAREISFYGFDQNSFGRKCYVKISTANCDLLIVEEIAESEAEKREEQS